MIRNTYSSKHFTVNHKFNIITNFRRLIMCLSNHNTTRKRTKRTNLGISINNNPLWMPNDDSLA